MSNKLAIVRNLAAAFLSGAWSLEALARRGAQACGRRDRWLRPLVRRVLTAFASQPERRTETALIAFLQRDELLFQALLKFSQGDSSLQHRLFWVTPTMSPAVGAPSSWELPTLATPGAVAQWLGLTSKELDWFADRHGHEATVKDGPLRHYAYRWLPKPSGKWRLLEIPKPRLKTLQRRILHEILDRIPPHAAAHGYRHGRSIATFAAPHCGQRIVLRFDLSHFFPSVRSAQVHALFATAGYPKEVARLLTGLCTNVVPEEVWQKAPDADSCPTTWTERQRFRLAHLPQGAPTSPTLANLCAYRFDCRLHGLAKAVGTTYTRYADDLAFSGGEELKRSARRFQVHICRIALEEGFEINTRKSRFMRQGVRQQLVGVVVNEHANIKREDFDTLKAILYNAIRHGPESQNREGHLDFHAHLLGRIGHVAMLNAARGEKLRGMFARIVWE